MFAAAAFALLIVAGGCAKEKSPPQSQPEKKVIAGTKKKDVPKPSLKLFTGTIEALDEESGTLTLKGPKGTMRFQGDENVKKQFDGLDIGDKVIVKHSNKIALSIVRPRTGRRAIAGMASPPLDTPP
jgi:hypothetical protein